MRLAPEKKHHYFVNGLEISSEFQLPELNAAHGNTSSSQASFKLEHISDTPFFEKKTWLIDEADFQIVHMKIAGVARYQIKNGNEILIDPLPGASEKEVRLFLLGSAFGILLHQRGVLPVHASAVKVNGACVIFVGDSGAGKSTLAAFLNSAGYEVISDDVCALTINKHGKPVIWPGVPRIKLWSDALDELQYNSFSLVQDSSQENKFHLPVNFNSSTPIELASIYELNENKRCEIRKLGGGKKMQVLAKNIYRNEYITSDFLKKRIFQQCATTVNNIDVFKFSRPKNFSAMKECLADLEYHWDTNAIRIIN